MDERIDLAMLNLSVSIDTEWPLPRPTCSRDGTDTRPKPQSLAESERRHFAGLASPDDFTALRSHRRDKGGSIDISVSQQEERVRLAGGCGAEIVDGINVQWDLNRI